MRRLERRAEHFLNPLIASGRKLTFITELFPRNYYFKCFVFLILAFKKIERDPHAEFLRGLLCLLTHGTVEPLTNTVSS